MKNLSLFLFIFSISLSCAQSDSTQVVRQSGEFIDSRDQQIYPILNIGNQTWMAADLKFATKTSICYENLIENCQQYGRLYILEEAQTACPNGWHLPNEEEWRQLEKQLGMSEEEVNGFRVWRGGSEGEEMKKQLQIHYAGIQESNDSKFTAKDFVTRYWVDSPGPSGPQYSIYRMLMKNENRIYSDQITKKKFLCVRCVKDK